MGKVGEEPMKICGVDKMISPQRTSLASKLKSIYQNTNY